MSFIEDHVGIFLETMDLIVAETLGLAAHAALGVAQSDWAITAVLSDLQQWHFETAFSGTTISDHFRILMDAAKSGSADHPDVLFSGHAVVYFSSAARQWLCVGWDALRADQVHLSAGQHRVLQCIEHSLSKSTDWASRLAVSNDQTARDILGRVETCAAIVDDAGVLMSISSPFADLLGWPPKALLNRSIPMIWPGGPGRRNALLAAAGRGNVVRCEVTLVRRVGEPQPTQVELVGVGTPDHTRVLLKVLP